MITDLFTFPEENNPECGAIEKAHEILEENTVLSPVHVIQEVENLAGGRILVIGLADLEFALKICCKTISSISDCSLDGKPKMYVEEARDGGFREILQRTMLLLETGGWFPFELQVLTYLQHTWDQLQHRVYEKRRAHNQVPEELETEFERLSDDLYGLNYRLDKVRRKIPGVKNPRKSSDPSFIALNQKRSPKHMLLQLQQKTRKIPEISPKIRG